MYVFLSACAHVSYAKLVNGFDVKSTEGMNQSL